MSRRANIATQRRMIDAVNRGELDVLHDIFAEDVIDHDAAPDQGAGPAGYVQFFRQFRAAFPDLQVAIEHLVADEDCIAIAVKVTGTHHGPHLGHAPTGRAITIRGMQIARFDEAGRICERWGSSDERTLLNQLGVA